MAAVSIALGVCLLPVIAHAQQAAAPKRILILYWYNREYAGNITFEQNFRAGLQSAPPGTVEIYSEYLESNRFPGENQEVLMRNYLRDKYVGRNIDVIMAVTDKPLEFLLKYRHELFTNVPIVFVAVKLPTSTELAAGPGMTGIVYGGNQRSTLELALRLHPDTEQVFIVSGTLDRDKRFELACRKDLEGFESKASITYLTDLPLGELIANLRSLPERSIVLYLWQQSYDEKGGVLESPDVLALISLSTRVPIYGLTTPMLGSGIVGGNLRAPERIATSVAEIAVRIITGTRAQDIPVQTPPTVPMFDSNKLRLWGISEDRLPPGSIVQFKQPSFWQLYKWRIIGVIFLVIVQSVLITGLLFNRAKRKRADDALRQSESRNRAMLTALPDLIFILTRDCIYLDYHARDPEALFEPPERFIGRSIHEVLPEELARSFERCIGQTAQSDEPVVLDYALQIGGEERYYESSIVKLGADRVMCIVRDITGRKRAEMRFRRYFELPLIGMAITSPDRRFIEVNQELCDMLGYSMDELTGKSWVHVTHPDDVADNVRLLEQTLSGETEGYTMEKRFIHRDGHIVYTSISARCVRRADRTVDYLVLVLQGITERRLAEEALQKTQSELAHVARVMITGELAATIAHEVNQPLTAMVANANATRRMLGNGKENLDEAREAIDDIVKDAHRASEVLGRIRSLLRKDPHRTEPLAINEVIEEVVTIARNDLVGKRVSLRMELADGLPKVEADRVEIQQVLLNLMMNAVEAMRSVEEGDRNLLIRTTRDDSGGVLVEVRDSGIGIAPENLERIFDAFYTTRKEGMGMGLSICRTIIEAHGGRLWAQSSGDRNATLRFTLRTATPSGTNALSAV